MANKFDKILNRYREQDAGGGGGSVSSVNSGTAINVDNTDPANPIVNLNATTANVTDSLDKRYVTDAQKTVIQNTSGTNTGDQTSVSGNAGTATKLATARNIDGQSFDGSADITVIAPGTHAATSKTTPVDADELPLVDSAASNILKKLTWSNLKATLKTYFDGLYPSGSGTSSGTNTGDQTGGTPALTLGTTNSAGSSAHFLRDDDTILAFDATSPSTQGYGDSAVVGVATVAARRDHKHAMPATTKDTTANSGVLKGNGSTVSGGAVLGDLGTTAADFSMNSHKLTNVTDPSSAQDAATKNYVDTAVLGLLDYRGSYDASGNAFPSSGGSGLLGAVVKGDFWICSVPGTLGGVAVTAGDLIIALVDTPGQTASNWDLIEYDFGFVPENVANKSTDGTMAANSDTLYASQKAARTYADTKLAKASNLSDVANASTSRTNLGVAIGSNVQAWDADLDSVAAIDSTAKNFIFSSGTGWVGKTTAETLTQLGIPSFLSNFFTGISIPAFSMDWWRSSPRLPQTTLTNAIASTGATTMTIDNNETTYPQKRELLQVDSELVFANAGLNTTTPLIDRGAQGTTAATHAAAAQVKKRLWREVILLGDSTTEADVNGGGIYTGQYHNWPDILRQGMGQRYGGDLGKGYLPMWHQAALSRSQPELTVFGTWSTIGPALNNTYMGPFAGTWQGSASTAITSVTTDTAADTFTSTAHGLVNGAMVFLSAIVTSTGISTATTYYVVNTAANTFQLSLTIGGSVVDITGSNGSCTVTQQAYVSFLRKPGDELQQFDVMWEDISTTPVWSYSLDNGKTWVANPIPSTSPTRNTIVRTPLAVNNPATILVRAASAANVTNTVYLVGFDRWSTTPQYGVTQGVKVHNAGYDGNTLTALIGSRGSDDIYYTSGNTTVHSSDGNFTSADVGKAIHDGNVHFREGTMTGLTIQDAGDTITKTAHGLNNGDRITFTKITSTTGLQQNITHYYVVAKATNTFQVSASVGGSAVALTTDGTCELRYETGITVFTDASTVTVSTAPTGTVAAGTAKDYIIQGTFNVAADPLRVLRGDPGSLNADLVICGFTNDLDLTSANGGKRTITGTIATNTALTVTSPAVGVAGALKAQDVGKVISGTGIPAGTKIQSVNVGAGTAVLDTSCTNGSGVAISIGASEQTINDIYKYSLKMFDDEFSPYATICYWAPFEQGATRLDGSGSTSSRQSSFRSTLTTHASTYNRASIDVYATWSALGFTGYAACVTATLMDGAANGFHEGPVGHREMASRWLRTLETF